MITETAQCHKTHICSKQIIKVTKTVKISAIYRFLEYYVTPTNVTSSVIGSCERAFYNLSFDTICITVASIAAELQPAKSANFTLI